MDLIDAFIDFTETSLINGLLLMNLLNLNPFGNDLFVEGLLFVSTVIEFFLEGFEVRITLCDIYFILP